MYSDKENSNILTAVMKERGIKNVVVCPGSRNVPLVNDFREGDFDCISVTDERSAGFYALGLSLATHLPVAVCVTSGSALLNLAPAVVEAFYRHVPLLVISADRPTDEIDQLQGQTITQPGALGSLAPCYNLPILSSPSLVDLCKRRAAEAVDELCRHHCKPVHINVPMAEPLFNFTTAELPTVKLINTYVGQCAPDPDFFRRLFAKSSLPLIVVAQQPYEELGALCYGFAVLHESLGLNKGRGFVDEMLDMGAEPPDLVIYFGDTLVSKRAKKFLGANPDSRLVLISADGRPHDVSGNLTNVIDCDYVDAFLRIIEASDALTDEAIAYQQSWQKIMEAAHEKIDSITLPYGAELAVKLLEESISDLPSYVHYANSTAVRYANRHARGYRYVNRGVNGIEGSLSTAAGFSLAVNLPTFCVIGDLSFFYDCNALWPSAVDGNLRILLLNNSKGSIFGTLPGIEESAAFPDLISGTHSASAEGICAAYNTRYRKAHDLQSLESGLVWLINTESTRPLLLEVIL